MSVTFVTNPINLSNATAVTVSGTGDVGSTVVVTGTDGTHTTASQSESWLPTEPGS